MIKLKRAYDRPSKDDGARYLVERLWPRGIKKTELPLDGWLKDVAPSPELRKWFGHDVDRWTEFRRRYKAELEGRREELDELRRLARNGRVTLIFGARDEKHNDAVVLRSVLLRESRRRDVKR